MKHYFENIGEIEIEKLSEDKIIEASEMIVSVYQHEKIWLDYTVEETIDEMTASFKNYVYKPTYFIVLLKGKIIGIAGYMESFISTQGFELSFATIHPEHQRKGLGKFLTYLRLKEITEKDKNAVIFTRARRPKLFEKFGFKYIHQTKDADGCDTYDYMFCPASELNLNEFEKFNVR